MFEIIAGLIAFSLFASCAYRWLWRDETPVLHSILAAVAVFAMMFMAEGGLVITAAMNKGID